MEYLKDTESFGETFKKGEEENLGIDIEKFFGKLIPFFERRIFNRISKRVNFLLTRINGQKLEIVADGNSDKNEDGNWRFLTSGDTLLLQENIDGTWTISSLTLAGIIPNVTVVTNANYIALATDFFILVITGATTRTVTLPASPVDGRVFHIKKIDSGIGLITLDGNGNTIDDDASSDIMSQYESFSILFANSEWNVF